jgi:hypothetical protein
VVGMIALNISLIFGMCWLDRYQQRQAASHLYGCR